MINPKKTMRRTCSIRPIASSAQSHRFTLLEVRPRLGVGPGPGTIPAEFDAPPGFEPLDPEDAEGAERLEFLPGLTISLPFDSSPKQK
jgi:hypothetical protein